MKHAKPEVIPPVKTRLSGLRATIREGNNTMTVQNNVEGKLYFRINREEFVVNIEQFLGILNRLLSNDNGGTNENHS